jgi:uncharacterized protein YabN with tetrapyrrole methylase and pyrophosphatase domain
MTDPDAADATAKGAPAQPLGVVDVAWNITVPEVDVHLVGYGDRLPNDFTLETLAVLQRCKRVFGAPPIHAPEFNVPPMEHVLELDDSGRRTREAHEHVAEIVLAAAAVDPPVALATYGSPMVGTHAAHRILDLAPQHGLTVHVSNAVPSFDGLWADFNIEPFFGFEIWDATRFVDLAIQPSTQAHLLLAQAPGLHAANGPDDETAHRVLRAHLLRFYAEEHEVHVVAARSPTGPHMLGEAAQTVPLRDLGQPGQTHRGALLVPRAQRAPFDFERYAVAD